MKKFIFVSQGILQMFIGLGGVVCGFLMIIDPGGGLMTMPLELIASSPFTDYLIPGIILFSILGVGNVVSSIISFKKSKYAGYAGILFGSALIIWILVQIYMIGLDIWLQPFYLFLGVVELVLGILMYFSVKKSKSKEKI